MFTILAPAFAEVNPGAAVEFFPELDILDTMAASYDAWIAAEAEEEAEDDEFAAWLDVHAAEWAEDSANLDRITAGVMPW